MSVAAPSSSFWIDFEEARNAVETIVDVAHDDPEERPTCIVLTGQSGMGKSTLTNALVPEANAATREISAALDSGKHTTTFARLYPLGEDRDTAGWLIDSPGLQAFGLAHLAPDELSESFVEFRPHLGQCRFRDCRHEAEPGCALRGAVEAGLVATRRFEHYRTIRDEIADARRLNPGW